MAINTIEYTVDIAGVTPAAEQFVGTQGDHRVAEIAFTISDTLYSAITAAAESGKILYRFDVYDGEGGIWSSDALELTDPNLSIELEERHTRFGGKITVYLVITALSADNETEMELYSFPAVLRLNDKPEGIKKDGENYDSITGLVEVAKAMADDAALSASAAESSNHELQEFAAEIEEKLKNGDFDGVGVQSAEIVNDELIITYTNGAMQNLGNVKGDKGDTGPQGEKGDTGADGKDAVTDQTYNAESENAQSGKAVATAVRGRMPKMTVEGHTVGFKRAIALQEGIAGKPLGADDEDYVTVAIAPYDTAELPFLHGEIATYGNGGRLNANTPIDDFDCANKAYVDDIVGDIETALDELHNYAQAIIGGAE